MDFYQRGIQAFEQGRQRAVRNELAKLTSGYLAAPQEQRAAFAPQFAAVDPETGMDIATAERDRGMERLRAQAAFLEQASPEVQQRLYGAMRPQLTQIGIDAPEQFTPDLVEPIRSAVFGQTGGTTGVTPSMQNLLWQRRRGLLSEDQFRTALQVLNRMEAGAQAPREVMEQRWNPVTRQMENVIVRTGGYFPGMDGQPAAQPQQAQPQHGSTFTVQPTGEAPMPTDPESMRRIMEGIASGQDFSFTVPASGQAPSPAQAPTAGGGGIRVVGAAAPSFAEQAIQTREEARQRALGDLDAKGPIQRETDLRKEFANETSTARDTLSQFTKVQNAARDPSAAGDLSLIFSFMKMLDPGSVVREQEFANAQNAAGVPDQIINLYNRLLTGERLNPTQRADFVRQAQLLADDAQNRLVKASDYYRSLASDYGLNPDRVVRPSNPTASPPQQSNSVEDRINSYLQGPTR